MWTQLRPKAAGRALYYITSPYLTLHDIYMYILYTHSPVEAPQVEHEGGEHDAGGRGVGQGLDPGVLECLFHVLLSLSLVLSLLLLSLLLYLLLLLLLRIILLLLLSLVVVVVVVVVKC